MGWREKLRYTAFGTFGVAVLLVVAGQSTRPPEEKVPEPPRDPELEALATAEYMCAKFVPETLNDPDSAEFVDEGGWFRKRLSETEFQVIVQLRARNAFNALMYGEFDCRVEMRDGNWRVLSISQM